MPTNCAQQYCFNQPYKAQYLDQSLYVRDTVTLPMSMGCVADGLSQCPERLPRRSTGVPAANRRVYDGRWTMNLAVDTKSSNDSNFHCERREAHRIFGYR